MDNSDGPMVFNLFYYLYYTYIVHVYINMNKKRVKNSWTHGYMYNKVFSIVSTCDQKEEGLVVVYNVHTGTPHSRPAVWPHCSGDLKDHIDNLSGWTIVLSQLY